MADKQKLTKNEIWLQNNFRCKITDLPDELQAGGKAHDQFLKDLDKFREIYELVEKLNPDLKRFKPDKDDKQTKKCVDVMLKAHKTMEICAKQGDIKGAIRAFMEYVGAYKRIDTPERVGIKASDNVMLNKMGGASSFAAPR